MGVVGKWVNRAWPPIVFAIFCHAQAKAALQAKYNADINAQLAAIAQQQKDTNKAVINSSRPRLPSAQLQICRGRKTKGILSFRAY